MACIPSIVRQITSPHLTDFNVKIHIPRVAHLLALDHGQERFDFAQSLTTGPLATTRPRVSILLLSNVDWTPQTESLHLFRWRSVLLEDLVSLREEGRLRIMRCFEDPQTHEEVMSEL